MSRDRFLFIRTALRKSPQQLSRILDRKLRNRIVPRLPIDFDRRYERQIPDNAVFNADPLKEDLNWLRNALSATERTWYRHRSNEFVGGSVTFLNRSRHLKDPATVQSDDERLEGLPRLWYLKLAGFEPLEWLVFGFDDPESTDVDLESFDTWIREFHIDQCIGSESGYLRGAWTPYAVSHRIINLSRYAAWTGELTESNQRFLFKNLLFLEKHIEEDVGGNHLIENGAALVLGGAVFPQHGHRFVERGIDVLQHAVTEQFLDDGYHYERSPMYHLAVTERLLSVCAVGKTLNNDIPEAIRKGTGEAHAFIEHLITPDRKIPLLNDAVFGETFEGSSIVRYGNRLGFDEQITPTIDASGLVWLDQHDLFVLADYGASGPKNLLAHTHNDPFTICVWVGGTRVITDTGTYDYQPGTRRQRSRGVRAHNTAHPEGTEPAAFDGRFLMADRLEPTVGMHRGSVDVLYGVYSEPAEYEHQRWLVNGDGWILVWDSIAHEHNLVSRLHTAPGIEIRRDPQPRFVKNGEKILHTHPLQVEAISIVETTHFPKFGVETQRGSLVFRNSGQSFGYLLSEEKMSSVSVEATDSNLECVIVGGEQFDIPEVEP